MSISARVNENLKVLMPKIRQQVAQRTSSVPFIDLGTAENWLIRDEIAVFFRDVFRDGFSLDGFSYQKGFSGDPVLLDTLADFLNTYFCPSWPVTSSSVCVAPGGGAILESFLAATCDAGEGALVLAPFWSGFHFQFSLQKVSIVPVNVPLHASYSPELVSYLEEALKSATVNVRAVVICNPNNPLGGCYPRATLEEIARFCELKDLHLLSDEVYALSTYESPDLPGSDSFTGLLDLDLESLGVSPSRIHMMWSISKDFSCSGLRLGVFGSRNEELVVGVAMTSNTQVSHFTSAAVQKLLSRKEFLSMIIGLNKARLAMAYSKLTDFFRRYGIQYIPATAGLFVWVKLSQRVQTWDDEARLANELAAHRISVSSGKGYGAAEPGWYRLTFTIRPAQLESALSTMALVLENFMAQAGMEASL